VASILESLPPGTPARVFAEVDSEDERQALPSSPWFEVTWLYRRGEPAGASPRLVDAVRRWPWPHGGNPYAWGGAESRVVTAIRQYLRQEVGLRREAVSMTGYWRA
jgi:NADPH-dependent ferric siderophore reductase